MDYLSLMTNYRQDLHKIPEIDRELPQTAAYVERVLDSLSCQVFRPYGDAVCAYFNAGREETMAFRSDMDALPVPEETGLPFASTHAGCMHACGHDGHMALLLGLAQYVNEHLQDGSLRYNVLLIFQPAEETDGGADEICRTGVMQRYKVRYVFGSHLWPTVPEGVVATRIGEAMARSSELAITIHGKSSHVAKADQGIDAMEAGARFLLETYRMEREELPRETFRMLKFGTFRSGNVSNAISDKTVLEGGLRAFSDETWNFMYERLCAIARGIEQELGCTFEISASTGYPAVINDEALVRRLMDELSVPIVLLPEPFMTTEDFSFYQRECPGVFFFLGTGGDEPLHSTKFNFNESVLAKGLSLYADILTGLKAEPQAGRQPASQADLQPVSQPDLQFNPQTNREETR